MRALVLGALTACFTHAAPTVATTSSAGFVHATTEGLVAERARMRAVLDAAPVGRCYEALLQRAPEAWGEVVVRFELGAAGQVTLAEAHLATLADEEAVRCVLGVARTLQFPAPSQPGWTLLYPYVFTSDRTPPEAARALRVRYAGEPVVPPGDPHDPKTPAAPGTITLW